MRSGGAALAACIRSMHAHTAAGVPFLIVDGAGLDSGDRLGEIRLVADAVAQRELLVLQAETPDAPGARMDLTFGVAAEADVVLLDSQCVVAAGWLEGLREAAYSDAAVATASAMVDTVSSSPSPTLVWRWAVTRQEPRLTTSLRPSAPARLAFARGSRRPERAVRTCGGPPSSSRLRSRPHQRAAAFSNAARALACLTWRPMTWSSGAGTALRRGRREPRRGHPSGAA